MLESFQVVMQIAPIFLTLIFGALLKQYYFKVMSPWTLLNGLCYWFLAPMLLFNSVLNAELQFSNIVNYLTVLFIGLIITFVLVVVICNRLKFSLAICNSTVQAACRHNTFIALAISGVLLGKEGFAIATMATAFQVVVTNLLVMGYITAYTQSNGGAIRWHKLITNLVYNPLLLSIVLALVINQMGVHYIPVVSETTSLLGRSAMPLSLLAAGAGLSFSIPWDKIQPLLIGVLAKMVLFPLLVVVFGLLFELTPAYFLVAIIYAAVPTAATSYVIARLTGGDAPLLSSMTMLQIIIAFFSFLLISLFFDFTTI